MPFQKGNQFGKNNKRGLGKHTKEIRRLYTEIVADNVEETSRRLSKLSDPEYFRAMAVLMKHTLPAQKQVEMDVHQEDMSFQIEIIDRLDQVTNKQAEEVLDSLVEDALEKKKNL